jgi:protein involved in plasmid replication-relaxation
MGSSRLPRFKRSTAIALIKVTSRDREILALVYRHRFLRSSHITSLVGGSSQQILRRLQLLFHHGFLGRPRGQIDYYHKGGAGHMVYGLASKGATLLKREARVAVSQLRWSEKNRSVGRIFLEHALLVSDVMVTIELACRASGRIRLLIDDGLPFSGGTRGQLPSLRWKVSVNSSLKLGLIPDRVFGLEFDNQLGNRERAFFFLEADRGTMPVQRQNLSQTSFYRKLIAYEATWAQSIHRTRFGFHRFRVLTVTTSPARVKSLVEVCSQLKHGHGLFLFVNHSYLTNPGDFFSQIWRAPAQKNPIGLLQ